MAESDWQEVKPLIDEIDETIREEQPVARSREISPTDKKELLKSLYGQELEILRAVEDYPDYDNRFAAYISDDVRLINNPDYKQTMTIEVDSIQGLEGYSPLHPDSPTGKVSIELDRRKHNIDGTTKNDLLEYGVNTNIRLVVGAYSDQETLESMRQYIKSHPEFEHRLITMLAVDKDGNGVKSFFVPKDFPIDESHRKAVVDHGSDEKRVYDDLGPNDAELMGSALSMLHNHLPTSE